MRRALFCRGRKTGDAKGLGSSPSRTAEFELRHALLWLGSTTLIWQICSWFLTLLTARLLSPSDYGMLALAETAFPYLAIITNLGITTWAVQRRALERDDQEKVFAFSLALGVLSSSVFFAAAPRLAAFYHSPELAVVLQVLAPVFLLESISAVPKAMMRRQMRFKTIGLLQLWLGLTRSILQLALAFLGCGYGALVAGILLLHGGDAILALYLQPIRCRPRFSLPLVREILRYGIPATAAAVCQVVFSTADNVVVGRLFGAKTLGFYAMAFYLTDLPMSKINTVLRPVALTHLSRLQHSPPAVCREFLKLTQVALFLTLPVLTGLLLTSGEIVPLLLGNHWLPMVPMLQVLCAVGMLRALGDTISTLLLAIGRPRLQLKINLVTSILLPCSFYLAARGWGLAGIYFAWLSLFPMVLLYSLREVRGASGLRLRDFFRNALAPASATGVMALAVHGVVRLGSGYSLPTLLGLKIAAGVCCYGLMLLGYQRFGIVKAQKPLEAEGLPLATESEPAA